MMTVHVPHAGDGYTYLTRQVASGDHQPLRGEKLSDHYLADGNPPGRWVGTGRTAMDVDGPVSEAQMKALFGSGVHPDAEARIRSAMARGLCLEEAQAATRLGRRFPVMEHSGQVWRERLGTAYQDFHAAHGRRPERGPERDLVRWNVASDLFRETHEREPAGDGELKAFVARAAKPPRQPVAGVDLVFTPVKSVSTLWALGDGRVRRQVEQAHEAAWQRALAYLEEHAALTRTGAAGIAQVDTRGLVAATSGNASRYQHVPQPGLLGLHHRAGGRVVVGQLGGGVQEAATTLPTLGVKLLQPVQHRQGVLGRGQRGEQGLQLSPAVIMATPQHRRDEL